MKIAVITYSDRGAALAKRIKEAFEDCETRIYSSHRLAGKHGLELYAGSAQETQKLFEECGALVFVCACGIAVRMIAPCIKSKESDPAVIVVDDRGRFVIPILSGHIGGANRLAGKTAAAIGAQPVVTTATDCAGVFSCDEWAAGNGCYISSLSAAKTVSAGILCGEIPVCSQFALPGELPAGLVRGEDGESGIYIGIYKKQPFKTTLRLVPRIVTVGVGCRRGIAFEAMKSAVETVFSDSAVDLNSVRAVATIDVKKDEPAIIGLAKMLGVPLLTYSADELAALPDDRGFAESEFVKKTVGVGNVCERACAFSGGAPLIRKTAAGGVTVAAAVDDWSVIF